MYVQVDGERVRKRRMDRGWSQAKLAEHAEVGERTIQRLEKEGRCSLDTLARVAKALGVSIDELRVRPNPHNMTSKTSDPSVTILPRLETAKEVLAVVSHAYAYEFDYDDPQNQDEVEMIAAFLQLLQEYGDIWDDLDAGRRVEVTFVVEQELKALHEAGFWVFGSLAKRRIRARALDQTYEDVWPVAVVYVAREDNPTIVKGHIPTFSR